MQDSQPVSTTTSNRTHREAGFSLIELIVVITIIGILATAVVMNLTGSDDQARVGVVKADMVKIIAAADMFKLKFFRFPESIDELMNPPAGDAYFKGVPKDPWTKEPYIIEPTDRGGIRVISYGADMQEGGDEYNADIFSDQLN